MLNAPTTPSARTRLARTIGRLAAPLLLMTLATCAGDQMAASPDSPTTTDQMAASPTILTAEEKAAGWQLLFDGQTFNGWRGLGRDHIQTEHWVIENGNIKKMESGEVPVQADGQPLRGGDLMTIATFDNFEFSFEWRISAGGNSGVKYNVSEEMSTRGGPSHAALGFEYQVLDDDRHPDGADPDHRTGGLYDLIPPGDNKQVRPVGEYNQSRIVFDGNHGEHWLNGAKVVEFDLGTPEMDSTLAASKYANIDGFGDRRKGHIVLQDHSDAVWYRNLKIRELPR